MITDETYTYTTPCVCVQHRRVESAPTTTVETKTAGRRRVSETTHDPPTILSSGAVLYTTTVRIQYNYIQQRCGAKNYDTITNNSGGVAS